MKHQKQGNWIFFLFTVLLLAMDGQFGSIQVTAFSTIDLAPSNHGPIVLAGNDAVDQYFAGNVTNGLSWGTAYVIKDLQINANQSSSCIEIKQTNKYLLIDNVSCSFPGEPPSTSTAGIYLEACQHVNITSCVLWACHFGVYLYNCTNIKIKNSNCLYCKTGIYASQLSNCILLNNQIFQSTTAVNLNTISNSEIHQLTIQNTRNALVLWWTNDCIFTDLIIEEYPYGISLDYSNNNRFRNIQFINPISASATNIALYESTGNDFGNYTGSIQYYSFELASCLPTIATVGSIIGVIIAAWIIIIMVRKRKQFKSNPPESSEIKKS